MLSDSCTVVNQGWTPLANELSIGDGVQTRLKGGDHLHKQRHLLFLKHPYARDDKGEIMNIGTPKIREITTPDQLREKLLTN
jgi:hypothetical protein